ncbi:MAG: hypothetical protein LWW85_14125, partial [Marinilabiliales bacterium]|nr:hypothetical protein [Marinilabiliales bacterium]
MKCHSTVVWLTLLTWMLLLQTMGSSAQPAEGKLRHDKIAFHAAQYDAHGKLLPWKPWEEVLRLEMDWYHRAPADQNGWPVYFLATFIDPEYKPYKNEIIPCTQ